MASPISLTLILDAIILILLCILAVLVYRRLVTQSHVRAPQQETVSMVSFEEQIVQLLEERHALKTEELSIRRKQAMGILSPREANAQVNPVHARLKDIEAQLTRAGVL